MPHRNGTLDRTHPGLSPVKPGKPYLMVIRLKEGRTEHANVLRSLIKVSCSPPTPLFPGELVVYGFRSTLSMGEISEVLGDAKDFLAGDSYVLVELASDYLVVGAESAKAWLRQNLY